MPVTGCHSVIDRPDRVSRVMPPITTIRKIMPQQHSSQIATGLRLGAAALACSAAGSAIAVGSDTPVLSGKSWPSPQQMTDGRGRNKTAIRRSLEATKSSPGDGRDRQRQTHEQL